MNLSYFSSSIIVYLFSLLNVECLFQNLKSFCFFLVCCDFLIIYLIIYNLLIQLLFFVGFVDFKLLILSLFFFFNVCKISIIFILPYIMFVFLKIVKRVISIQTLCLVLHTLWWQKKVEWVKTKTQKISVYCQIMDWWARET